MPSQPAGGESSGRPSAVRRSLPVGGAAGTSFLLRLRSPSMNLPRLGHPNLGLGVGLRTVHFPYILEHHPAVDWFEVIS